MDDLDPAATPPPPATGPRAAPGWPYALALAALAILAVAFGLVARLARRADPGNLDEAVARWVLAHRDEWPRLTAFFAGVTHLGNPNFAVPLVALVAAVLGVLRGRARHRVARGEATFWLAVNASGWLLATLLKLWFRRDRPPTEWRKVLVSSYSFPSIHASFSAIFFGSLGVLLVRALPAIPLGWRLSLFGACLALAVAVAASRVWLAAHWTTDVIGGTALGLAWVLAAWTIRSRWSRGARLS